MVAPAVPRGVTARRPLDVRSVRLLPSGRWGRWQERNAEHTIPHCVEQLEVSGVLDNLRRVVGESDADYRGFVFADSDLHKTIEAVAWEIARSSTTRWDPWLDDVIGLLARVQEDDGYLHSWIQGVHPEKRFAELEWTHEMYITGHLIQAAVALSRAAGRDDLLTIARKAADLVWRTFGPGGREGIGGHPEIETALVELFRHTGEERYLTLAALLVDRRGHGLLPTGQFGADYFQDHLPVRESTDATGHAVRQLYLNAGVTDVLLENGDATLTPALAAQWRSAHERKMYLTGAFGSRHRDEAFGDDYELPPDRAYAETCASIADLHWAWRMMLLGSTNPDGDEPTPTKPSASQQTGSLREPSPGAEATTSEPSGAASPSFPHQSASIPTPSACADIIERELHNALAAAVDVTGTRFFYSNPLQLRADHHSEENAPRNRRGWYECACCPPNLARLHAQLGAYLASSTDTALELHHYTDADIDLPAHLGDGTLRMRTRYPDDGVVILTLDGTLKPGAAIAVRIPAWSAHTTVGYGSTEPTLDGYHRVTLTRGVPVRLTLDLTPRWTAPHPRIDASRGCLAVERGPVVYCVEQIDLPEGADLDDLRVDPAVPPHDSDPADDPRLAGAPTITVSGFVDPPSSSALYRSTTGTPHHPQSGTARSAHSEERAGDEFIAHSSAGEDENGAIHGATHPTAGRHVDVVAIPFADWGNRDSAAMRVWIPER
jgi:DUF1680 family protein